MPKLTIGLHESTFLDVVFDSMLNEYIANTNMGIHIKSKESAPKIESNVYT